MFLQEAPQEPQPQAVPYAATVTDAAFVSGADAGPVDLGIERGLATAPATEIADVAYSQPSQAEEVVRTDSSTPDEDFPAVTEANAAAQNATRQENDAASDQVTLKAAAHSNNTLTGQLLCVSVCVSFMLLCKARSRMHCHQSQV